MIFTLSFVDFRGCISVSDLNVDMNHHKTFRRCAPKIRYTFSALRAGVLDPKIMLFNNAYVSAGTNHLIMQMSPCGAHLPKRNAGLVIRRGAADFFVLEFRASPQAIFITTGCKFCIPMTPQKGSALANFRMVFGPDPFDPRPRCSIHPNFCVSDLVPVLKFSRFVPQT